MAEGPIIAKMRWSQEGAVVVDMTCVRWGLSSLLTMVMWHAVIVETMWVGWLSLSMTILFIPPLIPPGFRD